MARKGRRLSPDEVELWARVAATARPAHPKRKQPPAPRLPVTVPEDHPQPGTRTADTALLRISGGKKPLAHDLAPALSEHLASQPLRMDAGKHKQMRRGKIAPEARIDLHGLTLAQAHPELIRFITASRAAGRRLVLVITGKGSRRPADDDGPIPVRAGALRHQVPRWLAQSPLSAVVQQIAPAHVRHGGEGAYYVYLRRPPGS
ncbi:Smr/MutS family protein [Paracoccus pacificus]|uniref:Smr/MutS family protein n=1 Tax=Paracoccus pacificus TaxID=1463598 RepID=A0ABW4R6D6_9RHOB